jgi:hypothetical protein
MGILTGTFPTDGTEVSVYKPQSEKVFFPKTLHLYNDHATTTAVAFFQDVAVDSSMTIAAAYLRVPIPPKTLVILSDEDGDFGGGANRIGFYTQMSGKLSASVSTVYFTVVGEEVG